MLTVRVLPGQPPRTLGEARVTSAWEDDAGRQYATARIGPDGCWLQWDGLGAFRFRPPSRDVQAWPADGAAPDRLLRTFERFLQPIVLQAVGHPVLHASGILGPRGVIAFCGVSGSGKSTLAYGFSKLGLEQVADDALVLGLSPGGVVVHRSPFLPRLRKSAFAALGPAAAATPRADDLSRPLPLAAILILTQAPDLEVSVRVDPVAPHLAFARVLTHAHSFDPENPGEVERLSCEYLDIVDRIPVFDAAYRPDFSLLPDLLTAVLERTASRRKPESPREDGARASSVTP